MVHPTNSSSSHGATSRLARYVPSAFVVVWIALVPTGCKRGMSCETLAARNQKCADAFVDYAKEQTRPKFEDAIAQMPESERPEARRRLARRFAVAAREIREELASKRFVEECHQSWNDREKFPPKQKEKLRECLKLKNCAAYAACFMNAGQLSKKPASSTTKK